MATATGISIPRIEIEMMEILLIGDSPLISHKWSDKAKKMMLDKQTKAATAPKEAKNPHQDFLDSIYHLEGSGYGFPAVGFKAAAVSACRFNSMKMTEARGAFHIIGDMVRIEGDEPQMREDMVRIGMGTADIRYRAEFRQWHARLLLRFNTGVLSAAQIVNLFNLGGFGVGIGEWRPETSGSFGMFHVATEKEAQALA